MNELGMRWFIALGLYSVHLGVVYFLPHLYDYKLRSRFVLGNAIARVLPVPDLSPEHQDHKGLSKQANLIQSDISSQHVLIHLERSLMNRRHRQCE